MEASAHEGGPPPRGRGVYCNRTLNLRAVRAVGYDMDYTLVHYRVDEWERRAYEHIRRKLLAEAWPVDALSFDSALVVRGLVVDLSRGNVVKANRFGYVKRALHGTRTLEFDEQRKVYGRTMVDLAEEGWVFLNTFFSLSEACMYAQLVDLADQRRLPGVLGYADLWRKVHACLDAAHMEGELKAEILADPARFIEADPGAALALLDQKRAGKKLLLITNSEWDYTRQVMAWAFDPHLPEGTAWSDLFDVVIVGARKPDFFSGRAPVFEVVTENGLLTPSVAGLRDGGVFFGGCASLVEEYLGLSGDEILYVGDHIYSDVFASKRLLRWRTAIVLRELEEEVAAVEAFLPQQARLDGLMARKEEAEQALCRARLMLQRRASGYGPSVAESRGALEAEVAALRRRIDELDQAIGPLAKASGELVNARWGPLMRAGSDKSHLARQVERRADVYTSRVSNLLFLTPFAFLRSSRGSLPHDPGKAGV